MRLTKIRSVHKIDTGNISANIVAEKIIKNCYEFYVYLFPRNRHITGNSQHSQSRQHQRNHTVDISGAAA